MPSSPAAGSAATHTKSGPSKESGVERAPGGSASPAGLPSNSSHSSSAVSAIDVGGTARRAAAQNGHVDDVNGHDESEAETVLLSDAEQKRKKGKKMAIKAEDNDDGIVSRRSRSPALRRRASDAAGCVNGSPRHPRSERNGHKKLTNGTRRVAKSPAASDRSHSNHSAASSGRRRKSPSADELAAPISPKTASTDRGRASSVSGSRKRKIRDEHHLRNLEPPRQRLKSDPASKGSATDAHRGAPVSPTASTTGLRSHKRSASTQSLAAGVVGRRRREVSATHEAKQWKSDASSESSESPQPTTSAAHYSAATRTKRSSHRSVVSPARAVGQIGHPKKNVDKFGATRLAREGEKGNLDAVRAAYEAAPEELDQADFAGFTPIQKASLNGHADVVEFLISKSCRIDCQSKEHDTPLIDAVENGHLDVVRLLIDAGVNPHHQNKKGERAVDVLNREEDNVDEIEGLLRKAMLEHASDDDSMSTDIPLTTRDLVTGEQRNDLLYVESTLTNLRKYAAKGDAVAVDHFLGSITPDTACVTGAARGGHEMVLNLLLASPSDRMEKDPDPAKHSETPLIAAIGRGHLGILQILLDQDNFNPTRRNKNGKTYYELAEELKGPKWQQEVDLLKERYDAYRVKKQAQKKRSLGPHAAEKTSKVAKLRSPRSPEAKRGQRTSSPVPSSESKDGRMKPPKIKQEKTTDGAVTAPLKKLRTVGGMKSPDATKASGKFDNLSNKPRRRRVVDEDSEDEIAGDKAAPQKRLRGPIILPPMFSKGYPKGFRPATVIRREPTPESVRLRRIQNAENEANRLRLSAERERLAEEQRAAEVIEARKRAERQERLDKLPIALKHACERGANRPLHFSSTEVGISMCFLPLQMVPQSHITNGLVSPTDSEPTQWVLSFQAVGILGLPELDVHQSFPEWETKPVSLEQRHDFLKAYDISILSRTTHTPCEDEDDFDPAAINHAVADSREKFLAMEPLVWVKVADLEAAVAQQEWLASLTLTKVTLSLRPGHAAETRTFEDMIASIVAQHQRALLTPSSTAMENSPKSGGFNAPATEGDQMDIDQPGDGLAPASSGIV